MPKQVFKILQFHGGISNDSDPRDIAGNQFVALENVAVDEVGKIVVLGDIKTTHFTQAGAMAVPGGRGLMTIKTDYSSFTVNADSASGIGSNPDTDGAGGGTEIAAASSKYYITAGSQKVTIDGGDSETADDLPMNNMTQASMYWAKGALRLYDADHTDDDVPQWRGVVKGVLYGTDSGDQTRAGQVYNSATASGAGEARDQWYTVGAQIRGCFEPAVVTTDSLKTINVGLNLIMGNGLDATNGITYGAGVMVDSTPTPSGAWTASQTHGATGQTSTSGSGTGATHSITTDGSGNPTFTLVTGGTGYAAGDTIVYTDPHVGTSNTATVTLESFADNGVQELAEKTSLFGFANEICGTGTGAGTAEMPPGAMDTASGMYWGLGMHYQAGADGTGTWAPTGNESYQFYCTTIYDGNQESSPQLFSMYPSGHQGGSVSKGPYSATIANNSYFDATPVPSIKFTDGGKGTTKATGVLVYFAPIIKWVHSAHGETHNKNAVIYNFGAVDAGGVVDAGARVGGNPRISGLKCYWASSEDGFSDLWELWEWDFAKGFRATDSEGGGSGSYALVDWTSAHNTELVAGGNNRHYYQHPHAGPGGGSGVSFNDPPKIVRYEDNNGHTSDELVIVQGFKASVLQGGRIWIGNVKIDDIIHGDAMIKSKGGQYDKFPVETNRENILVDDGDEIVALSEFADRILQFKANTLYIINASGEYVGVEAKHAYKGVTNPGAVCRTDYGVAWANAFGCYVYDGQKVIDLLEEGGQRKINKDTWSTHIGIADYHRVGFNPTKRQIIVTAGGSSDAGAYIYDMVTKSWTKSTSLISDADTGSNFINDLDTGDLLIHDAAGTIDKWVDTPLGAQPQITKIVCVADSSNDLDQKSFYIEGNTGKTLVWIDTNASGSAPIPFTDNTCDTSDTEGTGATFDTNPRIVQMTSTALVEVGMYVSGTGITTSAQVTQIDSATLFRIDEDAASDQTNTTLTFGYVAAVPPTVAKTIKVVSATNATAKQVAIDIANAVGDDSEFSATVQGDAVIITDAANAARTDAANGTTSFTITTVQVGASSGGGPSISIKTKDIDFGEPSVRKKIYKVYVSYKGDGDSVTVQYAVNGDTDAVAPFYRTTADGSSDKTNSDTTPLLNSNVDDWIKAELKPVSSVNNINSFQLIFGGTAETDFEINDISIVYRVKNIK